MYKVVEDVSEITDRCALLTDLDPKGRELYSRLKKDLQKHGVHVDDTIRNYLFKNTKLRQIEGLLTYLKNQ